MKDAVIAVALLLVLAAPAAPAPELREVQARVAAAWRAQPAAAPGGAAVAPALLPSPELAEVAPRLRQAVVRARAAADAARPGADDGHAALAAVAPGLELHRRENGTLRALHAEELAPAPAGARRRAAVPDAAARALDFAARHRRLFRLEDPAAELAPGPVETDDLGRRRVLFRQLHGGLPVWPTGLAAHFDREGRLQSWTGAYIPTPALAELAPRLPAADAVARTKARLPGGWAAQATEPELIVHAPLEGEPRLAWKFDLTLGLAQAWRLVVAADDGRTLHRGPLVHDASVAGRGVDLTGATRGLNVWRQGQTHYLIDASKPSFDPAFDPVTNPRGVITILDARDLPLAQLDNNVFHITSPAADAWSVPAGVSAAFNFSLTFDYFLERHGRSSLDGAGGNITALVRVDFDDAFWNGALSLMAFGNRKPYAASLDVVAHELAHGVTEKSANLIYQNQSGALNEAFSDIFGELVEARARGRNDWLIGSELAAPLRNMREPGVLEWAPGRPYPATWAEFVRLPNTPEGDNGGVHINSSIINRGFHLLAEGLPGAVGLEDAGRIFYRALTRHLQAQSQFIDARLAAVLSAGEIFGAGSTQARRTAEAFDAIGVTAAPATPAPTPVPVVTGEDANLHLYPYTDFFRTAYDLYRRETARGDGAEGRRFARNLKLTRPAVSGDGALAVLVTEDHDLCLAATDDPASVECLGLAGRVHAVALSPDGRRAALVLRDPFTGQPLNRIELIDLVGEDDRSFGLVAPTTGEATVDQIRYADAMSFTTDSRELVYDALSRVRFATGGAVERWSIFSLGVATGTTIVIVPPIEGLDTGNPALGRAGTRYLAFDAVLEADGRNFVFVADLFTGTAEVLAATGLSLAYPGFTGDEGALVYAAPDGSLFGAGFSLFQQRLTTDRLAAVGDPVLYQEDARLGVIYRRGAFTGTNALPSIRLALSVTNLVLPGAVTLTATAGDPDGTVQRVEFYDGAARLGEGAPLGGGQFSLVWNNPAAGSHHVIARAVDNLGGVADSAPARLTVRPAGGGAPTLRATAAAGRLRLVIEAPPGSYEFQQSADLVTWQTLRTVTVGAGGTAATEEPVGGTPGSRGFFRLRQP